MNSTWDTRNLGSGHFVENLDSIFLGGEKERKNEVSKKVFYKDRGSKRTSKETEIAMV